MVFERLAKRKANTQSNGQSQPRDQILTVIDQQSMMRPRHGRARQKQDHGHEERHVQNFESLDVRRRPYPTKNSRWEESHTEVSPEERHKEHHFGRDKQQHAVTKTDGDER